jgi:hypothetical protein
MDRKMSGCLVAATLLVILPVTTPTPTITRAAIDRAVMAMARQPPPVPVAGAWSAVIDLAPGHPIDITLTGGPAVTGQFVLADHSSVVVLNLTGALLSPAIARVLLNRTTVKPDEVAATLAGRDLTIVEHVHMGPRGVFVDDRKIAELHDVVERILRTDVVEIRQRDRTVRKMGLWGGGMALLAVGLDVGLINLYGLSQSRPGETTCYCDGYLGGAGVALGSGLALAGGLLMHRGHERQEVVYAVRPR